ncbi:prephenate dehydratase [Acetivibrio ethanolgignens]|uniref:Bifunctional chorismate mutase/prephenate dehydratase n=1 Tax=Acetivibrio ethanolgignens TaxID=290052 RepID=A0A0V8QD50_9FIRM|nr:prephenate dehydratase [Acetivibrio ethanolgignens]KSV58323.1 bifunctional chorismate mutase/prephenate dehydratase [Acetivibrio ethanolgignens]
MLDLSKIRENIDEIDTQMVELFEKRMALTKEVAEYKMQTGKAVLDKEREAQKLNALSSLVKEPYNTYPVQELFTQIMSMSRKYQYSLIKNYTEELSFERLSSLPFNSETRVVFFGETGSYSEQAMEEYFGTEVTHFSGKTFKEVMTAVHTGAADYGVLPIENSSTGGVLDMYDLLVQYDNYILSEHIVPIRHALLGLPGASLSDIRTVYSHPQGIMQCSAFLEAHPEITPVEYLSTALGAKRVLEKGKKENAAIASLRAADCYGLSVLQECLNRESTNSTRFIIIGSKKAYLENASKVSLCFELPHESGTLYNMLSHFIYNNLNMTKIESRPISGRPWEYRFFVDVEGNLADAGMKNAITGIQAEAESLKILGNFTTI